LSSNDPRVLVGLGAVTDVRSVEVRWQSGKTQALTDLTVDRYYVITER